MRLYTVRNNDTIASVAAAQHVEEAGIVYLNELQNNLLPTAGHPILLPARARLHEVASGDSLAKIAALYGISVRALLRMNPSLSPHRSPRPGTVLTVGENGECRHTLLLNGILVPGCPPTAINEALPYLNFLTFEHTVFATPQETAFSSLVERVLTAGVRPLLTIDIQTAALMTRETASKAAERGWSGVVIPISGLTNDRAITVVKHLSVVFAPLQLSLFCRIRPDDCYRRESCLFAIVPFTDGFFFGDCMAENDLALLHPVCPPSLRCRMFPCLPTTKRGDARGGRRRTATEKNVACDLRKMSDTLTRIAHDCYGGLAIPVGGTSHGTYAMLRGMFSFQEECETDDRHSGR